MFVKIFGIERSGTNWIQELMALNTNAEKVFSNCYAWKHGVIEKNLRDCDKDYNVKKMNVLIISKNPYSWHDSIKRYSHDFEKNNFEFWFKKYNKLYKHYIDFEPDEFWAKKYIVRYEDLLINPDKHIKKICRAFRLIPKSKMIIPDKVFMSAQFNIEKKIHYLQPPFCCERELIERINKHIEDRVFEQLNYGKL